VGAGGIGTASHIVGPEVGAGVITIVGATNVGDAEGVAVALVGNAVGFRDGRVVGKGDTVGISFSTQKVWSTPAPYRSFPRKDVH